MQKSSYIRLISLVIVFLPCLLIGGNNPAAANGPQAITKAQITGEETGKVVYISGKWIGSDGLVYYITQNRHRFTWTVASTRQRCSGKVIGRNMTVKWRVGKRRKKVPVTGQITEINIKGKALRIEWSNGIIFDREDIAPGPARSEIITKKVPDISIVKPEISVVKPMVKLPQTLLIGDFTLKGVKYDNDGQAVTWGPQDKKARELSGTGWVDFDCGGLTLTPVFPPGTIPVTQKYKVVPRVIDPGTQVSLSDARMIKPDARVGGEVEMKLPVKKRSTLDILRAKIEFLDKLKDFVVIKKGDGLVRFDKAIVIISSGNPQQGRIVEGEAYFPVDSSTKQGITLKINGFTAVIDTLTLTPTTALAHIILQLPGTVASADNCGPAELYIGTTTITPKCEFYVNKPDNFGAWIIGNTGMIVEGEGFIADFSSSQSPPFKVASWKGVSLKRGRASGDTHVPENSNTGYLAGQYHFILASVSKEGFEGKLRLTAPHTFHPTRPIGYEVSFGKGKLVLSKSRVISGELQNGEIILPTAAVGNGGPGNPVKVSFSSLMVRENLNLTGEVNVPPGTLLGWGELTHPSDPLIAWNIDIANGYFFLPSGPVTAFSPDTGAGFLSFQCQYNAEQTFLQLEALGMAGVTFCQVNQLRIYSPDRPGGTGNPIKLNSQHRGWLHIGSQGVDGKILIYLEPQAEALGNDTRFGYEGNTPFRTVLSMIREKKRNIFFAYADSAVYDSEINGYAKIPVPSGIPELNFSDMETTSTANLVGGDIMLDAAGEELAYWKLKLAPTSTTGQAGVMSVRTGRIAFTAARISEEKHFDSEFGVPTMIPFPLTWGEMLADGNFGKLFLNPNTYGQRFDGIPFTSYNFVLSKYIPGNTDGYFDVCGTTHFGFFGSHYLNIRDARFDSNPNAPHHGRYVTVPANGEAGTEPTDLHLHGEWNNKMAVFDFPNNKMGYYEALQDGFTGTGDSGVNMIHSDPLTSTIEVHRGVTDICFTSQTTHDLRFASFTHTLCGIKEVYGCARIEGPLLQRIAIGGYMDNSAHSGFGILSPKAAAYIETNLSVTPTSSIFYAAGDIVLSVAASALDISGHVRLAVDHARNSAEGEAMGRFDCNTVLAGLTGEGQATWYMGPDMRYFQGKMKMAVCSWVGSAGLEGGLFIGHNVPKAKAWVLNTGSEHFGVDDRILPARLTGLYGYGQAAFSVNWYIFGGGIEIYAGMGAFADFPGSPPGLEDDWGTSMSGLGLPYVLGSAGIHVHGEILGGLVSASAWGKLDLRGPIPIYFSGTFGLEGCVLWVLCASVDVTAGISPTDGFFIE
jgi:hypothetical protein